MNPHWFKKLYMFYIACDFYNKFLCRKMVEFYEALHIFPKSVSTEFGSILSLNPWLVVGGLEPSRPMKTVSCGALK